MFEVGVRRSRELACLQSDERVNISFVSAQSSADAELDAKMGNRSRVLGKSDPDIPDYSFLSHGQIWKH